MVDTAPSFHWGCFEQSRARPVHVDTQAFPASLVDVDGLELAPLDLVQHRLAGHAEDLGCLVEPDPAVGDVGDDPASKLVGDADVPGAAWRELLADDEPSCIQR